MQLYMWHASRRLAPTMYNIQLIVLLLLLDYNMVNSN